MAHVAGFLPSFTRHAKPLVHKPRGIFSLAQRAIYFLARLVSWH